MLIEHAPCPIERTPGVDRAHVGMLTIQRPPAKRGLAGGVVQGQTGATFVLMVHAYIKFGPAVAAALLRLRLLVHLC